MDQLVETDPEQITIRLGRSVSVFKGDVNQVLDTGKGLQG